MHVQLGEIVKLQRIVSRKVGNKTYYKWQITIAAEDVDATGWKEGDELESQAKSGLMVIKKARKP